MNGENPKTATYEGIDPNVVNMIEYKGAIQAWLKLTLEKLEEIGTEQALSLREALKDGRAGVEHRLTALLPDLDTVDARVKMAYGHLRKIGEEIAPLLEAMKLSQPPKPPTTRGYREGKLPPHLVEMRLTAASRVELLGLMATLEALLGDKITLSFIETVPCQRGWQVYAKIPVEHEYDKL